MQLKITDRDQSFDPKINRWPEIDVDFRLDAPVSSVIGQWKNVHLSHVSKIVTSRLQQSNFKAWLQGWLSVFNPANHKEIMALFTSYTSQLPAVLLLFIYTLLKNAGKKSRILYDNAMMNCLLAWWSDYRVSSIELVCFSRIAICLGEMVSLGFDKILSSIEYLLYKASYKGSARKPDIYILWRCNSFQRNVIGVNVDWLSAVIFKNLE